MALRTISASDDLQAAINAAKPGDVLMLEAGAVFTGPLTLPAKTATVTITSSGALPERRITPADAAVLPTIRSGGYEPAITGEGAAHWHLDGLRFEPTTDGHETLIVLWDADHVTFDRILFAAPEEIGQKRGILGNGTHITLTRSHIAGCWTEGADSQAFCAWDGAGPYTLTDNYLEAASENVLFGGADSRSADRIPSDILLEGNHLAKPLAWKGRWRIVKNLFELKAARRVTLRRNLLEQCWPDAQEGYAIVVTVRNQDGRAPWSVVEDVLIEHNVIRDTHRGMNISGIDDERPSAQGARLTVRNNLFLAADWLLMIGNEWDGLTFEANTCFYNGVAEMLTKGRVQPANEPARQARYAVNDHTYRNNLAYMNEYGFFCDGGADYESFVGGTLTFTHNALADRQNAQVMPGTNVYPSAATHEAQFDEHFRVTDGSPYQTAATDGGCLGARADVPPPIEPPLDAVAPDVRIVQIRNQKGTETYVVRVRSFAQDVVGVEYLVNGTVQFFAATWPFDGLVTLAADATHVVIARALDAAGNAGLAARTVSTRL